MALLSHLDPTAHHHQSTHGASSSLLCATTSLKFTAPLSSSWGTKHSLCKQAELGCQPARSHQLAAKQSVAYKTLLIGVARLDLQNIR